VLRLASIFRDNFCFWLNETMTIVINFKAKHTHTHTRGEEMRTRFASVYFTPLHHEIVMNSKEVDSEMVNKQTSSMMSLPNRHRLRSKQ